MEFPKTFEEKKSGDAKKEALDQDVQLLVDNQHEQTQNAVPQTNYNEMLTALWSNLKNKTTDKLIDSYNIT